MQNPTQVWSNEVRVGNVIWMNGGWMRVSHVNPLPFGQTNIQCIALDGNGGYARPFMQGEKVTMRD